ncbi:MAG: DUF937 domain-containing protein [Flavobacteriales bacterium]|nr:DUF937 domain-containing protein [Flavobacteriales bacterium]
MDVTHMILSQLGDGGLEKIAGQIGANSDQTKKALEGAVPALLGAMSNNSKDSKGASGLLGALDRDHDGSIFDDLGGFLGNFEQGPGNGILSHVLGEKRGQVESGLGQKTGLSSGQVGNLLKIVAPLVMGYLGKQKRENQNGFDLGSLTGLLGGLTKSADKGTSLDLGDILDVVGGLSSGGSGKTGGLGGLLGKLFARK